MSTTPHTAPPAQLLHQTKLRIWELVRRCPINLQVAADRAHVRLPITQVHEAEKLLRAVTPRRKPQVRLADEVLSRYLTAHVEWFKRTLPTNYRDGHYLTPKIPNTATANGLTAWIVNYLDWTGNYGNRISTVGRQIKDKNGQAKWIKGQTKTGTGDVAAIIRGRHVTFEVKIGRDTPSDNQLARQGQIRAAGGEYFFTHSAEEFFLQYDKVVSSISIQTALL